jgi:hypothetical protein
LLVGVPKVAGKRPPRHTVPDGGLFSEGDPALQSVAIPERIAISSFEARGVHSESLANEYTVFPCRVDIWSPLEE